MNAPRPSLEERLRDEWVPSSERPSPALLESVRRSVRETPQRTHTIGRATLPGFAAVAAVAAVLAVIVLWRGPDANPTGPSPSAESAIPTETSSLAPSPADQVVGLPGAWSQTAVPPIGGRGGHVLVWTGREALVWGGRESTRERTVFDGYLPRGGAAYDPATDAWRAIPDAPIAGRDLPLAAWTGDELLVWGGLPADGEATDGAAYDPARDAWRPLPPAPLGRGDAVGGWIADRFVVVTSDGAASYDPLGDAWAPIAAAPVRPDWRTAAVAAGRLVVIAYGDGASGRVEGAILDPAGMTWQPIDVPLEPLDAGIQAFGAGDLVVLPAAGQALDPVAATWRPSAVCPGAANGAAWTGRHVIGVSAAYDVAADRCLELPPSPPRAAPFDGSNGREFAVGAWTGDRYVTWSGGTGGDIVWVPNDGAVFVPNTGADPPPSPTPELTPEPTGTPVPTPPSDLPTSFVHEERGIRVTVRLERNPLPAGEATWATLEVRNTGTDDLVWFHDGCATAVGLWGEMTGVRWRPGVEQAGLAAEFKHLVVGRHALDDGTVLIQFVPERFVGRGSWACADIGLTDYVKPGEAISQRAQWDGMAGRQLGVPPAGPVRMSIRAGFYWRAGEPEPESIPDTMMTFEMPAWIVGERDATLLHPLEVVDAALADAEFLDRVAARVGSGHDVVLRFDAAADAWEVGVLGYDQRRAYLALVDPRSGEVRDLIERPWDPQVDPFP